MGFLDSIAKLFGSKHDKDVKEIQPLVESINEHFQSLSSISNDQLRGKTQLFKEKIGSYVSEYTDKIDALKAKVEDDLTLDLEEKELIYAEIDKLVKEKDEAYEEILEEILPEAFAVVKETARRFTENDSVDATATELDKDLSVDNDHIEIAGSSVRYKSVWDAAGKEVAWEMIHYDVQLIGGVVLHRGKIAEMKTGEGKTLVSTLPSYLNALTGEGVHLVTVNDYLARRDCEWMAPVFNFLGITVDCIDRYAPHSEERRKAYRADITYGTNNEFGFDYLRDNMVKNPKDLVQRKHHFAMVDEVDSVLVDDARTPLIISGPVDKGSDEKQFYNLKPRIQKLVEAQQRIHTKFLTDARRLLKDGNDGHSEGEGGLALLRAHRSLPKSKPLIKLLSEEGNRQILLKTENYYLQNNSEKMPEADQELFFVIEEKNNSVDLTEKGIELITGAGEDSKFFVLPDVGAEIAEIEKNIIDDQKKIVAKDQLMTDFAIKSERIHSVQQLLKAYALFTKDDEYIVVDGKVKIVDENTGRVMEGRRYSDGLHQAIEAKENLKVEAASQTWATITLQNYFRMYHKLAGMTGTAETEAGEFWDIYKLDVSVIPTNKPIARDDQEDLVYKTKREKYTAIINDVVEHTKEGRPVLVGTTSVEVSELLSKMLRLAKIKHNVLNAKQHQREADIVAEAGDAGIVTIATNMAGRGTDIKINDQVKDNGGLVIIGSERHDSRRIDRQLRGRAGRQGDPGMSVFYVSLEDNLMRLFGSDRISKVMDSLGYKEGEVITHSMITKSIERAQKKVEENNFGVRKRLLEYDDVMNNQRTAIYTKRRNALFGERLEVDIMNAFYDVCEELVSEAYEMVGDDSRYDQFQLNVIRFFSLNTSISEDDFNSKKVGDLIQHLYEEVQTNYQRKCEAIAKTAFPVLNKVFVERGETIKMVDIPFSDGVRAIRTNVDLEKAITSEGREVVKAFEKTVILALVDDLWKDHLRQMDDLKKEVQTATYEQKDPLLIFKLEAFKLFESMIGELNREITSFLFKGNLPVKDSSEVKEAQQRRPAANSRLKAGRESNNALLNPGSQPGQQGAVAEAPVKAQPVRTGRKVGRNDPCPCGSGKKYKKCHGVNAD